MPHPGELLGGRYRLDDPIAAGGMGEVWQATDTVLERPVAVKTLLADRATDPGFQRRFRHEARALAALRHPGVVPVYDFGSTEDKDAYLVMAHVDGRALNHVLADRGRLGAAETMAIVAQAARALATAHAAGIVHRDVKPGNLIVEPDGTVVLVDFGVARSAGSATLTGAREVVGTALYIAPEQVTRQETGPAADVYALGALAYHCLAGHPPFQGANPIAIALQHIEDEPPPLPDDVPTEVSALVMQAMIKDPAGRFPSAGAMAEAAEAATVTATERAGTATERAGTEAGKAGTGAGKAGTGAGKAGAAEGTIAFAAGEATALAAGGTAPAEETSTSTTEGPTNTAGGTTAAEAGATAAAATRAAVPWLGVSPVPGSPSANIAPARVSPAAAGSVPISPAAGVSPVPASPATDVDHVPGCSTAGDSPTRVSGGFGADEGIRDGSAGNGASGAGEGIAQTSEAGEGIAQASGAGEGIAHTSGAGEGIAETFRAEDGVVGSRGSGGGAGTARLAAGAAAGDGSESRNKDGSWNEDGSRNEDGSESRNRDGSGSQNEDGSGNRIGDGNDRRRWLVPVVVLVSVVVVVAAGFGLVKATGFVDDGPGPAIGTPVVPASVAPPGDKKKEVGGGADQAEPERKESGKRETSAPARSPSPDRTRPQEATTTPAEDTEEEPTGPATTEPTSEAPESPAPDESTPGTDDGQQQQE